jgi:hypothetical protein
VEIGVATQEVQLRVDRLPFGLILGRNTAVAGDALIGQRSRAGWAGHRLT